jgi:hypothetical protein
MPLFRVRLASRSALRADASRRFLGADYSVRVSDDTIQSPTGQTLHHGLLYTVEVDRPDIYRAIAVAKAQASGVADELSLAHAAAIDDPQPLFALSIEPEATSVLVAQVIRNTPELSRVRRGFEENAMRPVFDLLEAATRQDPQGTLLPRVKRAIYYLRRCLLETDVIDQFEDLCDGLQSIEPGLRGKYGTPTTYPVNCRQCKRGLECSECGAAALAPDNFSGVDHIVTAVLGRPKEDAKRLRDRRNDIVHSRVGLEAMTLGLPELIQLAREALVAGILDLLGGDSNLQSLLIKSAVAIAGPPEMVVVAELQNTTRAALEQQKDYPTLQLHAIEQLVPVGEAGRRTLELR